LLKDLFWKTALIGGLATATFQTISSTQPLSGSYQLSLLTRQAFHAWDKAQVEEIAVRPGSHDAQPASRLRLRRDGENLVVEQLSGAEREEHNLPLQPSSPNQSLRAGKIEQRSNWVAWSLGIWALIAALRAARLGFAQLRWSKSWRERETVTAGPLPEMLAQLCQRAGFKRQVRLTCSARLAAPIALRGDEICLPVRAINELTLEQQESMLAHELAHLVRRDPAWLMLCAVIEMLFFFQPLTRLARRYLREEAEYLCDDWAVMQTGKSLSLAKSLTEVATWIETAPPPPLVSSMGSNSSALVQRVQRLLEAEPRPSLDFGQAWQALLAAGLLILAAWSAPLITPDRKMILHQLPVSGKSIRILPLADGQPIVIAPEK
jgi:beta-lactamase regulating signal transducer with metallopeptidase domain